MVVMPSGKLKWCMGAGGTPHAAAPPNILYLEMPRYK
eukprot:gene31528-1577_t